jgi:hypothetical protein
VNMYCVTLQCVFMKLDTRGSFCRFFFSVI